MKLIGTNDIKEAGGIETEKSIKKIDEQALNKHDVNPTGFTGKLRDLVRRAIDCCIE